METQVRSAIKQKYVAALEEKYQLLQAAIQSIDKRNQELRELPNVEKNEISKKTVDLPDKSLIDAFFDAKARMLRAERISRNLKNANKTLDLRLSNAEKLLKTERENEHVHYVAMLSPTAAKLMKSQKSKNSSQIQGQTLEIAYLKRQIQAIEDLKNGAVPKPRGSLNINFDEIIRKEEKNLQNIQAKSSKNRETFSSLVNEHLSRSNSLQDSIKSHNDYAASFAEFQTSYNAATGNINALPFHALLDILKEESSRTTKEGLEAAIDSLEREKAMILERLQKMGVDDEESAELKHEINVQLLYLSHVTAVAEKALCKLSARKQPVDPLETLKIEIAEMEIND